MGSSTPHWFIRAHCHAHIEREQAISDCYVHDSEPYTRLIKVHSLHNDVMINGTFVLHHEFLSLTSPSLPPSPLFHPYSLPSFPSLFPPLLSIPIPSLPANSEEVEALRAVVQDLEVQIEEQKLKIQNTANALLRVSCHYSASCYPPSLFPTPSHRPVLITCSMQKQRRMAWSILYCE